jgi:vacuolar-type H+-ATPase subunit H
MTLSLDVLFYFSLILVLAVQAILVVVMVFHQRLLKRYDKLLDRYRKLDERKGRDAMKLLAQAKKRAHSIIDTAHAQAGEIVGSAEVFQDKSNKAIKEQLADVSTLEVKKFEEILSTSQAHIHELLDSMAENMKAKIGGEVTELHDEFQQEAEEMRQELQEESGELTDQAKQKIGSFESSLEQQMNEIKEQMKSQAQGYQQLLAQELGSFTNGMAQELKDYKGKLQQELSLLLQSAQQATLEERKRVEQEAEKYKKERLVALDAALEAIIRRVATETLGANLTLKDHEEQLLKSLEEAKKEHLFE